MIERARFLYVCYHVLFFIKKKAIIATMTSATRNFQAHGFFAKAESAKRPHRIPCITLASFHHMGLPCVSHPVGRRFGRIHNIKNAQERTHAARIKGVVGVCALRAIYNLVGIHRAMKSKSD